MKCPNCNKEAIFVNGKYVCLDCGIEISPEQQAAQNTSGEQVLDSDIPAVTPEVSTDAEQTAEPTVATPQLDPAVDIATPAAEEAKPVQQYYEEALKEEAPAVSGSGIYDFSDDQATAPAVPEPLSQTEPTVANLSNPEPASITESPIPETPVVAEPEVSLESPVVEAAAAAPEAVIPEEPVAPTSPDSYFTPSSFDINQPAPYQSAPGLTTEEPTEAIAPAPLDSYSPATQTESAPAFPEPAVPTPTLDEMLGTTEPAAPNLGSPVSAYGPSAEPTMANIQNESAMPSVESVFGDQPATPATPPTNLPTAQDFGVAPKPVKEKNRKWILPVAVAAGALVLLVGISLAVLAITNRNAQPKYPISLDEEGINTLSAAVSTAMQGQQGVATDYTFEADFTDLEATDTTDNTLSGLLAEPYQLTGSWYTDKDGDITTETSVGEKSDKRTYIASSSETFVYSPETQKYTKQVGQVTGVVPALFGVEEKTAVLYTTNIKAATLAAEEDIDGASYSRYEITPNEDLVKEALEFIGGPFTPAIYTEFKVDNLKVNVWVGDDNKLKKISLFGEIDMTTEKLKGTIKLSGEAIYQYIDVSIESPAASVEATKNPGTPVSAKSNEEEEGQTSSISNEENVVIEAKG